MAAVYPLLYVFENSARDLIRRVLERELGAQWWEAVAPERLRRIVVQRQEAEGVEAWHGARGDHAIQYLDLPDLVTLAGAEQAWPHLKGILTGRQSWFEGIVHDINVSRRVVAHMNPLSLDDVKQVEVAFNKWARQLQAKRDLIEGQAAA